MLTTPTPQSLAEIITPANLNEALHNYHSHLILSTLPLAKLATVQERQARLAIEEEARIKEGRPSIPSPSPLGAALAAELKSLITSLEPKDPALPASHNRRYPYEILHQTAILGRNATDVASRLFISRSQLYRIREKTLNDLCQLWLERENRVLAQAEKAPAPPSKTETETAQPEPASLPATSAPPPAPLPTGPAAPTAEALPPPPVSQTVASAGFRVVTVLVANLTNFNKVAASLDAEEAHALLNHLLLALDEPLKAKDGFVTNRYERGFSALFGAPVGHEDDAVRAVNVALELLEALEKARRDWTGQPPATWPNLRIAVSTGRVFAGTLGPAQGQRYSVTGAAFDLAHSLAERTPAGWVLIEQHTYKQVRGLFEIEALEALPLGDESEPSEVEIYRVLAARPQGELIGVRGVQGVETAMIGRDPEWSLINRLYNECRELNSVRQVTVVGPGGSGKSRLEYEFRQYLELQPHRTHYWRGQIYQGTGFPYLPFARMLRTATGLSRNDSLDYQRSKLLELCKPLFSGPGELGGWSRAEEVAHLLSVILECGWPGSPALAALENQPALAQWHTFKAFAALCVAFTRSNSRQEPLVLVLQDLHWAEEASLALWSYLASELEEAPVMLVGLTRPELYERKPDWGVGLDRHFRLDLKPLPPARARELIRHILRKLPEIPDYLVEQVALAADGNPFYIEEIINMLRDEGVLADDEASGQWRLARPLPNPLPTPSTIEGLIQARLDQIPPEERRLLELAAIIGRYFTAATLRAFLGVIGENDTVSEPLENHLASLQRRELLIGRSQIGAGPLREVSYNFKHSLLREVVYANLPRQRRLALHRALAEWLQERRQQLGAVAGYPAAALAEQFERAGLQDQAIDYYEEAAEEARINFALSEAVSYYDRALAGLDTAQEPERCAHLLLNRAWLHMLQAEYSRAMADLETTRPLLGGKLVDRLEWRLLRAEIAERMGQYYEGIMECLEGLQELGGQPELASSNYNILLKAQLGSLLFRKSRYAEAEKVLREALTGMESREVNNSPNAWREMRALAGCYKNLSLVLWARGDLAEAIANFKYILPLYEKLNDWAGQGACYENLGLIYRDWGEFDLAIENYEKAKTYYEKVGDRQRSTYATVNLGVIYWFRGELDKAETLIENARIVYERIGARFGQAVCANNLGQIYRDKGLLEQATASCQRSLEITLAIGEERGVGFSYNNLAKLAYDRGDFEQATELVTLALSLRQQIGHKYGEAASYLLLGWIRLEQDGDDQGAFEQARAICQAIDYKYGLAESSVGLGALNLKRGDYPAALTYLNEGYALAEKIGLYETGLQALLWLGRYYNLTGHPEEAQSRFERLLALAGPYYPLITRKVLVEQVKVL